MTRTAADRSRGSRRGWRAESARLRAIACQVPDNSPVTADIGSGHGRLPRLLLATGRVARCIASEKPGPAARALSLVPPIDGLEIRTGDGLEIIRDGDDVEVVVLAGMGGRTIAGILERGRRRTAALRRVVLQPQRDWSVLRRRLYGLGLAIVEERLVADRGRFYLILSAEPRSTVELPVHDALTTEDLLEAGPRLVRSGGVEVCRYWREQLRRLESILARAPDTPGRDNARRDRDRAVRVLAALGTSSAL